MNEKPQGSPEQIAVEIRRLARSMARLRYLGVIRSQKIVGDVGEWIAASLFNGQLAESKNQKGWDVSCDSGNMQVRAHAKAQDNRNQFTSVEGLPDNCAELAIVVLTSEFEIRKVFRVPTSEAKRLAKKNRLYWSTIICYEVDPKELPAYEDFAPMFAANA